MRCDSCADLAGAANIDKNIFVFVANAIGEPAMDPLASCDRPGVAVFVTTFDPEENFHPNKRRPAERLLPLRHPQLGRFFRRVLERKLVLAGGSPLPAGVEGIAGATDADRIDFLGIDRRPIL